MAHQLSVFAENRPGRIERITGILTQAQVNIRAITIASSDGFGVISLLVDKPDIAYEALKREGISVHKKDILALLMSDEPGGLHRVAEILLREGINIEDAYGFVIENRRRAVLVVDVERIPEAEAVLRQAGIDILTDDQIYTL